MLLLAVIGASYFLPAHPFFVLLRARRRRLVFCSGAAVGGVAGVDVALSELRVPLSCQNAGEESMPSMYMRAR
jgi:hypothetical protein